MVLESGTELLRGVARRMLGVDIQQVTINENQTVVFLLHKAIIVTESDLRVARV